MNELPCAHCGEMVTPKAVYVPNEEGHPDWDRDVCPKCGYEI